MCDAKEHLLAWILYFPDVDGMLQSCQLSGIGCETFDRRYALSHQTISKAQIRIKNLTASSSDSKTNL